MGKHVDTTRGVDMQGPVYMRPPQHRKPGGIRAEDPHFESGYNSVLYPDVWSGNADTDRAWAHEDNIPGYYS